MKIENNKIVECTEMELYEFWLDHWSHLLDFITYKRRCINNGVKII